MDVNATLAEIRALVRAEESGEGDATRLAELVAALDAWLTRGGFLPDEWDAARNPFRDADQDDESTGADA